MSADTVSFTAPLLVWSTEKYGNMGYIMIEGEAAEAISARIGESRWSTSVFPPKEGGWFLPVKKAICRAEQLEEGFEVEVRLDLL